ncbi:hypothetical protein Tco_0348256 [Tanacetum coccineum]
MTTPIITSTTDSQMHNNIMAAGSRDRPPMLAWEDMLTEKGFSITTSATDWLEDTDEENDEQELEAHYSFMAKIQEVLPSESNSTEPL